MTATIQVPPAKHSSEALRWSSCFALALSFHAAGAAALFAQRGEDSDLVANAPIVMVDLAPVSVSSNVTPNELPPGPEQNEAQPEPEPERPVEKLDLPLERQAEPLVVAPPPKTIEKPKGKQAEAKACEPFQRAERSRSKSRARRRADAGCLFAQQRCGTELEIAARRTARALQTLSVGSAIARRAWSCTARLQRRPKRWRAQCTYCP